MRTQDTTTTWVLASLLAVGCQLWTWEPAKGEIICELDEDPAASIRAIDTLGVVVVYAYSTASGLTGPGMGDTLPAWWDVAWNNDARSVQAY